MAPSRGAWYQTSEAVRILYDLRQRNIRISKKVVEVWRSKTPPLIDICYEVLLRHVKRVEDDVTRNKCTVDESITRLISDRTAVNLAPLAGRPRFMSKSQFVAGVLDSKKREESSNKHVALQVLNDAKTESYAQRGLRPPKACVHPNTVRNYWQHLGDKENKICTKVSDRSHARVQASRSIMHLFSYFFTILHTHVLVAPLGMGKEPSPDNWAALLLRRFGADTNFGIRLEQHAKGARLDNAESQKSNFYQQFPSKNCTHSTEGMKRGSFEDITFFVGTAFRKDTAQQPDNVLVKDVSEGGIFRWQKQDMQLAKTIPQGSTLAEKQVHMVALLLEMFDDLMIEPKYNVSESSGMDPFMRGRGPSGSSTAESRRLF